MADKYLNAAYKCLNGGMIAETIEVDDKNEALETAINIADDNGIILENIDFDEDNCLQGYDEDGNNIASFVYGEAFIDDDDIYDDEDDF